MHSADDLNPEIFQSEDENDDFLATTDDFHDDGKLNEDESLVAFNLSLKEATVEKVFLYWRSSLFNHIIIINSSYWLEQ